MSVPRPTPPPSPPAPPVPSSTPTDTTTSVCSSVASATATTTTDANEKKMAQKMQDSLSSSSSSCSRPVNANGKLSCLWEEQVPTNVLKTFLDYPASKLDAMQSYLEKSAREILEVRNWMRKMMTDYAEESVALHKIIYTLKEEKERKDRRIEELELGMKALVVKTVVLLREERKKAES